MKNITETSYGSQIVVWENAVDVLAGGVQISNATTTLFPDGVIPAGTLISVKQADGTHKVAKYATSAFDFVPLGMTRFAVELDDMPLVAVVLSGTLRKDALPTKEQGEWAEIAKVLHRITAV